MEKIVKTYADLMEAWNDDAPSSEFVDWFLSEVMDAKRLQELRNIYECSNSMSAKVIEADLEDDAMSSGWDACKAVIAELVSEGKRYEVTGAEWHGKLNDNFSIASID